MAISFNLNKMVSQEGRYDIDQGLRSIHAGVELLNTIDGENFSLQAQRASKIRDIVERTVLQNDLEAEKLQAFIATEIPDLPEEQKESARRGIELIHLGVKACQKSALGQERIIEIKKEFIKSVHCGCRWSPNPFVKVEQFRKVVQKAWDGINTMTPQLLDQVLVEDLWAKILPFCGAQEVIRLGTSVSLGMSELIPNSLDWLSPEETMGICGTTYRVIRLGKEQPPFICDRLRLIEQCVGWAMYELPPKPEKGEYPGVLGLNLSNSPGYVSEGLTLCGGCDINFTWNHIINVLAPQAKITVRAGPGILEALGEEPVRSSSDWIVLTNNRVNATYGRSRLEQETVLKWYQCSLLTAPLCTALCVLTQRNFGVSLKRHPEGVIEEDTSTCVGGRPIAVTYDPSSSTLFIRSSEEAEIWSCGSGAQWKV
jgi:hypothetical protein